MKQIQMFLLLAGFISTAAVSGQQAASRGNAPADVVYAQPGQLVDAGGFRLNLYCMGSGSPTVVFDSGWGDWAPAWSKVQAEIANGRAPAAMTVPAPDLAIRVPCRVPACTSRASYAPRFTMPASPVPIFWWDPPSVATTCAPLRTCTWTRLRGWCWMTPIAPTSNQRRCKKKNIEDLLVFPRTCASVET